MLSMLLYNIIAAVAGPPLVAAATMKGRFGGPWRDRLGLRFARSRRWMIPRIWVHAASVGEARSAAALIKAILALDSQTEIFLSVNTPAGLETAHSIFYSYPQVNIMAAPLDFWHSPQRALARIKPNIFVIMETELWPGMINAAKDSGATLILAAGRMTARSFRRYKLIRPFMVSLLDKFDYISTVGEIEKDMYAALGAVEDRLFCHGNPKFDGLFEAVGTQGFTEKVSRWHNILWGNNGNPPPLIIGGSTHAGEEDIILDAFVKLKRQHPSAHLLLAPRHLTRVDEVLTLARSKGLEARLASDKKPAFCGQNQLVLLDSMGALANLYALANISIVGGSLCRGLMGHNPLEPAAVGSAILFGPHMSSFAREAESLLQCGAAKETSAEALQADIGRWLDNPMEAKKFAEKAQEFLRSQKAVAPILAKLILSTC